MDWAIVVEVLCKREQRILSGRCLNLHRLAAPSGECSRGRNTENYPPGKAS